MDRRSRNLYSYGTDPLSFSHFLKVPLSDVLSFFNKERPLVSQGFFPDLQESYLLNCNVNFDTDFFKTLIGAHLKSEEFLKIEHTFLADVVVEEPGNEHYRYAVGVN